MKAYQKVVLLPILIILVIPIFLSADAKVTCDNNDQLYWDEAVIDGYITEWDLNRTFFDVLWRSGNPSKTVTAKLYVMFEYSTRIMSILVINEPGYETDKSHGLEEFWVKYLDGTKLIDGTYSNFAFTSNGWEAKFQYNYCDCYGIQVHTLQKDDETSANYEVEVYIDCSLPVELSEFSVLNTVSGVELNWTTESEIENQGFIIERRISDIEKDWLEIASFISDATLDGQGTVTHTTNYKYIDNLAQNGISYEYRLADVDYNGIITYHSTRKITVEIVEFSDETENFLLKPAYPNPFNPNTIIEYGIKNSGHIDVSIYDLSGQKITSLFSDNQIAGLHKVEWNGTNGQGLTMAAGVYLASVTNGNSIKTTKLILVK